MNQIARTSLAATAAPVAEAPVRFRDLLAAEWIKIRSLRSTKWLLTLITLFAIGAAVMAALTDYQAVDFDPPPGQAIGDAFTRAGYMTLMIIAGSAGAITIVSEYSSGLIRTTTVAVPARGSVVLAKAAVVAAVWTVVGTIIASGSFAVSQAILSGRDVGISITYPGAFRALVAAALLAPVCALIGLGLGTVIRHSGTTMVTTAFTLLMLPSLFSTTERWSAYVNHLMPLPAWERLTDIWPATTSHRGYFATITESWAAYAVWPVIAIVVALVVVRRRNV